MSEAEQEMMSLPRSTLGPLLNSLDSELKAVPTWEAREVERHPVVTMILAGSLNRTESKSFGQLLRMVDVRMTMRYQTSCTHLHREYQDVVLIQKRARRR